MKYVEVQNRETRKQKTKQVLNPPSKTVLCTVEHGCFEMAPNTCPVAGVTVGVVVNTGVLYLGRVSMKTMRSVGMR